MTPTDYGIIWRRHGPAVLRKAMAKAVERGSLDLREGQVQERGTLTDSAKAILAELGVQEGPSHAG